jgi:predicted TIM-barrel fold metal-dependent hydrolase
MKTEILRLAFLVVLIIPGMSSEGLTSLTVLRAAEESAASTPGLSPFLQALAEMHPVDVHTHVFKKDPAFEDLLKRLQLRVLDICVVDDRDPFFKDFERQRNLVLDLVRVSSGRVGFCTTISPYDFEEPGFTQRVNHQLNQDFSAGAIAVKIYKTIGMEIKSKAGKYLMPDDPVFEPIYKNIVSHHKTIIAHLAEPDSCWQPRNPASPDYDYYEKHPEEYAYLHPEWPSKAAILAARDHVLAMNPTLRVVGAHLGSMEVNVNEMAQRFDRYPNFAVDTAARIPYFMLQPSERVRAFLIKYQDRVLYGTDLGLMPEDDVVKALKEWTSTYERDWKYFATDQTVEYQGHKTEGLRLPESVLHKLYHDNAIRWIPGIGTRP